MLMSLSDMLVVRQNTLIIIYTLRMGRQSMGLFRSSGTHLRIYYLKLFRQLLDRPLTKNHFASGKVPLLIELLIF